MSARITVIGKPDCHLCEEAIAIVMTFCATTGNDYEVVSILDDPVLADRYWTEIPVVLVDGRKVAFWRVTAEQLAAAIDEGPSVHP